MSRTADNWYQTPAVVVVGNSIQDFCLYWTLRAVRTGVLWAPTEGLDNWRLFADQFRTLIRFRIPNQHQSTSLISTSVPDEDLAQLAIQLEPRRPEQQASPVAALSLASIGRLLPGRILNVVMHSYQSVSIPFVDGVSGMRLPKASKGMIAFDEPAVLDLLQDVQVVDHRLPGARVFNSRLQPEPRVSRATTDGWVFNPARILTFAYDTWETAQVDVRLRLGKPIDECLAVFAPELRARLSVAGQYLMRAFTFFEDPLDAAEFLTSGPVARLLDAFRRTTPVPANRQLSGAVLHERRFLNFHDMATVTGLPDEAMESLLEDLIGRRVLRRGFAFQCPICRWADFYALATFGDEFECRQCAQLTRWQLKDSRHKVAPELFYGLDEILYRVADTDGHAVLRALKWLSEGSSSFMVAPGVNIDWPGDANPWEVDAVILLDGHIVLVEVKNATAIEQRQVNKYGSLAEALRADTVCFVSTKGWDDATVARLDRIRDALAPRYVKVNVANLDLDCLP
jgi:hypothetical protein